MLEISFPSYFENHGLLMNLDFVHINDKIPLISDPPTLEFVLYPERKVKEAITTGVLPHVVRTLLTKYNPPHLKCVKTIDVKVSFPKEDQGRVILYLYYYIRNWYVKIKPAVFVEKTKSHHKSNINANESLQN